MSSTQHPAEPTRSPLHELRDAMRAFAAERDWEQFHTPKNLASALAVEAAELMEPFQWLTPEQSAHLDDTTKARVADEIADVLLYLVRLADKLDIDVAEAARAKLVANAAKYPADKSRGSARKYTEL
jgi:NTP pyrophosphatase (non-canonical NTP hydrolase)